MTTRRKPERPADAVVPVTSRPLLASASHEIRAPVHTVLGMSELLAQTTLTPSQRQYVDALRRAATSLATLLDDILDLSKTPASTPHALREERFWLPDLAQNVVDVVKDLAEQKGLSLKVTTQPLVPRSLVGDPVRLQQVLVNLMVNAIKYTASGEVSFDVDGAASGPDARLVFSVADTGPGIANDQLQGIFEAWARLPEHGHIDGLGLGLAIARRLVDAMGGSIDVESRTAVEAQPGAPSGSTFRVNLTLPIAATTTAPPTPLVAVRSLRFLVIGSAALRDAVTAAVAAWAPRVEHTTDEVEGERLFHVALGQNEPWHVVVLDADLPYAGAVAFGATLRGRATVLIALRARGLADVGNLVEEIGATPVLLPVTTSSLYAALERSVDPLARLAPLPDDLPDLSGRVVHVVCADQETRALLPAFLEGTGLEVIAHKDERALLQGVADDVDRACLVVCDVDDAAAATAAVALQHDARTRALPVIALVSDADDAALAGLRERGFHEVLPKPFTRQGLVNVVSRQAQTQQAPALPPMTSAEVQLAARMSLARRDHAAIEALARRLPREAGKRLLAAARKKDDAVIRGVLRDLDSEGAAGLVAGELDDASRALLPDYLRRRAQDARDIADAVAAGRYDVVSFIGGKMADTGVAYGLPQLSEIGGKLDVAGKKREGAVVLAQLRRLQDLLASVDDGEAAS